MSTLLTCLPEDVIINNILSHLYPSDLELCKEANPELKNIIEENEEYIDTICQHIQPHGEYKEYYENGQLELQGYYKNGKFDGEWKSWYENGQIGSQYYYKEGELDGEYTCWCNDGQLRVKVSYEEGIEY